MLEALRSDRPRPLGRAFPAPAIEGVRPTLRARRERTDGGEAVIVAALCLVIGGAIVLVALQAICIVQNL
ncbi:hypothetical protein [Methylobacterium nonmethylotrophicum]|uniref:Uncharacterized protein n=1 Tax=Methylobacterium nonmethylotrophicum TaxID=1141884 RepID=A0A4Z0NSD6_9HYPH|nr:hypothetical protein [Methylobacterium nonmethylotrophicum]TGE00173.1 hypothetical protein EU555_09675 [Methylobacterium nonmethylotrophicum]